MNHVEGSCRFVCSPLETADLEPDSFDLIWGDAILHHLIPDLTAVLARLVCWAKPGALMVFGEPVNFSPTLGRHIPDLRLRHFGVLGRLDHYVLVKYNYEQSAWPRRAVANGCAAVDWAALSIPAVRRLGGTAVLYWHPAKAKENHSRRGG